MKKINRLIAFVLLAMTGSAVNGQVLVKTMTMKPEEASAYCEQQGIGFTNKPNGLFYRLREETPYSNLDRPKSVSDDMIVIITDRTDDGYVALFRNPLGADSYKFIAVTYNAKRKITGEYDLCSLSENNYCEVQDIRWYDGHLYFNMACPSYSSQINGRGSKLYSLDLKSGKIEWSSRYLTSNDVFTVDDDFVYCGYGFTDEEDFIYLLDRKTGFTLTKCPIWTASEYLELVGPRELYVQDYGDCGYLFKVEDKGVRVTGSGVRLRTGPTTSSAYLVNDKGHTVSPMKGDVLPTWGEEGEFFKVKYDTYNYVYISRLYSTTQVMPGFDSCDRPAYGIRAWQGVEDDVVHFEIYDMEKFCKAVGLNDVNDCVLETGTVYNVTIDSPLSCGVYIDMCYDNLGLYVMSEDCRAFGTNLTAAAMGEGIWSMEFGDYYLSDEYVFAVEGFETVTKEDYEGNPYSVVYAYDIDGAFSDSPLEFSSDEDDWADWDEPDFYGLQQIFTVKGTLVNGKDKPIDVLIEMETSYEELACGTITYHPGKSNESVINLLGIYMNDWDWDVDDTMDPRFLIETDEYLDDGTKCGHLSLRTSLGNIAGGTWTMGDKSYTLEFAEEDATASYPDWPELLCEIEAPAQGHWGWQQKKSAGITWSADLKAQALPEHSLRFSISNMMPNMAVVNDTAGDYYGDAYMWTNTECNNVSYRIRVFPVGVYIDIIGEEDNDLDCYGMGATITGWYPLIK